jgi:hypothetical protein
MDKYGAGLEKPGMINKGKGLLTRHTRLGPPIERLVLLLLFLCLTLISSCGKTEQGDPSSKGNSPPVISSATVLPEKPTKGSDLNIMAQSKDPDGDTIHYRYQWIKNEVEISGEDKNVLESKNFRKGDVIQVRVTPSDGKTDGPPFLSPSVRILNSLPVIETISVEPKVPYANDSLKALVKGSDRDGDFIYYVYEWEKNGVAMPEERGEILERGRFKKGDVIQVKVTPDDREASGTSKKSEPVTLSNSPPVIVSTPPNSVKENVYTYQVNAKDPDDDPVTFKLISGPKGMEMNKETGLLRWNIQKEDKGSHPVEIEVSDKNGAKSLQRYVLTVDFK